MYSLVPKEGIREHIRFIEDFALMDSEYLKGQGAGFVNGGVIGTRKIEDIWHYLENRGRRYRVGGGCDLGISFCGR